MGGARVGQWSIVNESYIQIGNTDLRLGPEDGIGAELHTLSPRVTRRCHYPSDIEQQQVRGLQLPSEESGGGRRRRATGLWDVFAVIRGTASAHLS